MTRAQFEDYASGAEWDFGSTSFNGKYWGMREGSTLAVLLDHRIRP
eukprot:CAMPEP_0175774694 /NCGR_PEP_ID=MMETSP0097-20121207/73738_1 /TAXON_ID=311494 /ORGANISM="Alexandrium monilatum, Strain CCMP3105" /LENGTH=45 /DNA_ID= /DNA_START= /DNA_END= /DNA_ORIENTATION=